MNSCHNCNRQKDCHDLNNVLKNTTMPIPRVMRRINQIYDDCEVKNFASEIGRNTHRKLLVKS